MPLSRKESKTVSFRLTTQEFEMLRQACEAQGVSSVSDFSRRAVRAVVELTAAPETDLQELDRRLGALWSELHLLAQKAAHCKARG